MQLYLLINHLAKGETDECFAILVMWLSCAVFLPHGTICWSVIVAFPSHTQFGLTFKVWILDRVFLHFETLCMWAAKALVRLRRLIWALDACWCIKYQHLACWPQVCFKEDQNQPTHLHRLARSLATLIPSLIYVFVVHIGHEQGF